MGLLDLFIAAVVPSLVLLWLIIRRDRHEREPFRLLLATFILGAFLIIPAVTLELALTNIIPEPVEPLANITGLALHNLTAIAIVEESCKLLATIPAYRSRSFNEPMDGIVYAAAASLGFAAIENVFYVVEGGWLIAFLRSSLSVPGHAFFGITMGFYLGLSKSRNDKRLLTYALVAPTLFHTIYNVIVSLGLGLLSLFLAGGLIFLLYRRVSRHIGEAQKLSPFKPPNVRYCIHCGSSLAAGWQYCSRCGGRQP